SFGQAVFFGTAGYGVALIARDLGVTSILLVLPAGLLIGLAFALLLGGFLLLGRHPSSVIFVSLGTLTGSYAAGRGGRACARTSSGLLSSAIRYNASRRSSFLSPAPSRGSRAAFTRFTKVSSGPTCWAW